MKIAKQQIEKYRNIVARVPAFRKEPTHFIEAHDIYTNAGTALSLDNLRTIIALWDENQALREALEECAVAGTIEKASRIADKFLGGGV